MQTFENNQMICGDEIISLLNVPKAVFYKSHRDKLAEFARKRKYPIMEIQRGKRTMFLVSPRAVEEYRDSISRRGRMTSDARETSLEHFLMDYEQKIQKLYQNYDNLHKSYASVLKDLSDIEGRKAELESKRQRMDAEIRQVEEQIHETEGSVKMLQKLNALGKAGSQFNSPRSLPEGKKIA